MSEIIKVKVDRRYIAHFPFDLFYLVPEERRDVLSKVFPASLCFPMTDHLQGLLKKIAYANCETYPHDARKQEHPEHKAIINLCDLEKHFLMVPILPLAQTAPFKVKTPAYIMAQRHRKDKDKLPKSFAGVFHDDVVMFTLKGPLRPICRGCPRHLLHLQGKCQLGDKECYTTLILAGKEENLEQLQDDDSSDDTATA
jgi:hypothetical protein